MDISKYLDILNIPSYKEKQVELFNCFKDKRDSLGILPTGYGKSVCYILPHLVSKKNVIVISPLIALMEDQNSKLQDKGINTITFNSINTEKYSQYSDLLSGKVTGILYFSPESFSSKINLVEKLLENKSIALFAIDECHCITTWCDFRDGYNNLCVIKNMINKTYKIPIMALTATATRDTIINIIDKLKLDSPQLVKTSFVKDQLNLHFYRKKDIKVNMKVISELIKKHKCKTIIYCKTIKETEIISKYLNKNGIESDFYHSKISNDKKITVQDSFINGDLDIMIATIAFGMGIDVSNIYLIIHYGISKDIESYYQEIGRGGRDGSECFCYLFWAENDFRLNTFFANNISDISLRIKQLEKNKKLEQLICSNGCRMKFIVNYFDEKFNKCGKCDNCLCGNSVKTKSINSIYIYSILKLFIDLNQGFGMTKIMGILYGSNSKAISDKMKTTTSYGIFNKKTSKDYINDIIIKLIDNKYIIRKTSNKVAFYAISPMGIQYYRLRKNKVLKSGSILVDFCKKWVNSRPKPATTSSKKNGNSGTKWTSDQDKKLVELISSNKDIEFISSELKRSKRGIEARIIQVTNENQSREIICDIFPSKEKIKKIIEVYNTIEDNTLLKNIRKEVGKEYSYFDITFAISDYGRNLIK